MCGHNRNNEIRNEHMEQSRSNLYIKQGNANEINMIWACVNVPKVRGYSGINDKPSTPKKY